MSALGWTPAVVVLIAACIAAATDIWKFRVYNALTIPLALSGIAYHTLVYGSAGWFDSLWGLCFGFAVLIVPYALGLMGAGDVKLLAGVGAWFGPWWTAQVFIVSALAAGVYALVLIACRGELYQSWITIKVICFRISTLGFAVRSDDMLEELAVTPDRRLRLIPFGASIPIGIVGAIAWQSWLT